MSLIRNTSFALLLALPVFALAQQESSSSSGSSAPQQENTPQQGPLKLGGIERVGSGIQLEPSESLFDIGAGLNACGYDADLENSAPVRQKIRDDINAALTESAEARDARDKLCGYINTHNLGDSTRNLSQYVSLGVFLSPPPELAPIVELTEMPPDAAQVVQILPLLRTFASTADLHLIWVKHRAEYEELVAKAHDPLTKSILNANIYLHQPVSSYDGRRFLVFLEPMFAPAAVNARVYGSDYVVAVSPKGNDGEVRMEDVRHMYLHYLIEPMLYARPQSIMRLEPILKTVQEAPLEFAYKNDMLALTTECMIKATEARLMDVGFPKPKRPTQVKQRSEVEKYEADLSDYERKAEVVRQKLVDRDMRLGFVLTDYFYGRLVALEHTNEALRDNIGEIVYAMDVEHERNVAKNIQFYPEGTREFVGRAPVRQLKGLDLAEMKLMKGDHDGAAEMADKALQANPNDGQAHYLKARIAVMQREPKDAEDEFNQVLKLSKDPRTLAWTHIYLGRMYDTQHEPDRAKAVSEYKAALAVRDARPDTKLAAEEGLKKPFAGPKRTAPSSDEQDDNEPIDPTGKKEKRLTPQRSKHANVPMRSAKKQGGPVALEKLPELLGHSFHDISLLVTAVTHSSLAAESPLDGPAQDNEQLEFVGDAVLGLVVAETLYKRFPAVTEGELTRMRAMLVSRSHLGEVAETIGLGQFLRLGRGEEQSGGRQKRALLSNALEAVVAAIYLDGGLAAARAFAEDRVIAPKMVELNAAVGEGARFGGAVGDYKSALQEFLQARGKGQPKYSVVQESGPDHKKRFRVQVQILDDGEPAEAEGRTKKEAQQAAARLAYEKLLASDA